MGLFILGFLLCKIIICNFRSFCFCSCYFRTFSYLGFILFHCLVFLFGENYFKSVESAFPISAFIFLELFSFLLSWYINISPFYLVFFLKIFFRRFIQSKFLKSFCLLHLFLYLSFLETCYSSFLILTYVLW